MPGMPADAGKPEYVSEFTGDAAFFQNTTCGA
jgi:hypothetical protein